MVPLPHPQVDPVDLAQDNLPVLSQEDLGVLSLDGDLIQEGVGATPDGHGAGPSGITPGSPSTPVRFSYLENATDSDEEMSESVARHSDPLYNVKKNVLKNRKLNSTLFRRVGAPPRSIKIGVCAPNKKRIEYLSLIHI